MDNPQLSIITINYNNAVGLKKTIESVISQSYTDYEYIVIDGDSNDGSKELIEKYSDNISHRVSEPDTGIYNAMNKGIKAAKGAYCLFLNSGDYFLTTDILLTINKEIKNEEIIYGNGRREIGNNKTALVEIPEKLQLDYFSNNSLFHPATFIKRSLFDTYGLYNESNKIVSDWEFFIKTIFINNVSSRKIPFEISVVEEDGISRSAEGRETLKKEVENVMNSYFPPSVLSLIDENKKLKSIVRTKNKNLLRRGLNLFKK
jgi:glycosyltransferase involved in cell wall biosynthesis